MKDKYSKEYCRTIALKYKYRIDFIKNNRNIYMFSYRRNYLNEICSHMNNLNNNSKRLIYRFIFSDNSCYVGLTYDFNKRKNSHLKYDKLSAVYIHMNELNEIPKTEILTELLDINYAKEMEIYWIEKSKKDGYVLLNKNNYSSVGGSNVLWTKEKCKEEALKYNNKKDFFIKSNSAYQYAKRHKFIKELTLNMI